MGNLKTRIGRVEANIAGTHTSAESKGRLPIVVSDETSKAEIARLHAHGREVLTFSEMANCCLVEYEPGAAA